MKRSLIFVLCGFLILTLLGCIFPISTAHHCESVPALIENGTTVEVSGGLESQVGELVIGAYNNMRNGTYLDEKGGQQKGLVDGISIYHEGRGATPSLQVHMGLTFTAFDHWFHVTRLCPETDTITLETIALDQTDQRPAALPVALDVWIPLDEYVPLITENLKVEVRDPLTLALGDDEVGQTVVISLQILDEETQYLYQRLGIGSELDLGRYRVRLLEVSETQAKLSVTSHDQVVWLEKSLLAGSYDGERVAIPEGQSTSWGPWVLISLREAGHARYLSEEGMMLGPMYEVLFEDANGAVLSAIVYKNAVTEVGGVSLGIEGWVRPESAEERVFSLVMDYQATSAE